jgi:hypothetical protein
LTGKAYIGKKLFTKAATKQIKGKKKKIRKESDWKNYYSSSNSLLKDVKSHGEQNFSREILRLCQTVGECSYFEAKEQFTRCVLELPMLYYNEAIRLRVHRSHLKLVNGPGYDSHSEKTKMKIRDANSGEKHAWFGRHHTAESIQKIKASNIGIQAGNKNAMFGKHHSLLTIAKIREGNMKKKLTDKQKERISQWVAKSIWIRNMITNENRRISIQDVIPDGWERGRIGWASKHTP